MSSITLQELRKKIESQLSNRLGIAKSVWPEFSKMLHEACEFSLSEKASGDWSIPKRIAEHLAENMDYYPANLYKAVKNAIYEIGAMKLEFDENGAITIGRDRDKWAKIKGDASAAQLAKLLTEAGLRDKAFLPKQTGSKGKGSNRNGKVSDLYTTPTKNIDKLISEIRKYDDADQVLGWYLTEINRVQAQLDARLEALKGMKKAAANKLNEAANEADEEKAA